MDKKLTDFIYKYLGKPLAVLPGSKPIKDGGDGPQCFDVPAQWCDDLGIPDYPGNPSPFPYDNASQIYTNFGDWQAKYFDRIENILNDESNFPMPGDIIVFKGIPGHVALVEKADSNYVMVIEQNWNNVQIVTRRLTKDWTSILGWLRPKVTTQGSTSSNSPIEAPEIRKWTNYTSALNIYKDKLDVTYYTDDPKRLVDDFITTKNNNKSVTAMEEKARYEASRLEEVNTELQKEVAALDKELDLKQETINTLSKQVQGLPKDNPIQAKEIEALKVQVKDLQEKLLYYHGPVFDLVDTVLQMFKKK